MRAFNQNLRTGKEVDCNSSFLSLPLFVSNEINFNSSMLVRPYYPN